jgi:hypothetical protein
VNLAFEVALPVELSALSDQPRDTADGKGETRQGKEGLQISVRSEKSSKLTRKSGVNPLRLWHARCLTLPGGCGHHDQLSPI